MGYAGAAPVHVEIEVETDDRQCKIQGTLEDQGIRQFKVVDVRGSAGGSISHLVSVPNSQLKQIAVDPPFKVVRASSKETTAWFESDGCDICGTIVSRGSFLVSGGSLEEGKIHYRFIAPHLEAFHEIVSELEVKGYKPKILKVERYKESGEVLTGKQELVLWHALMTGFFEYPRKVNSIELSRRLGIVPSSLSEMMRRGFRRLLESHFKSYE